MTPVMLTRMSRTVYTTAHIAQKILVRLEAIVDKEFCSLRSEYYRKVRFWPAELTEGFDNQCLEGIKPEGTALSRHLSDGIYLEQRETPHGHGTYVTRNRFKVVVWR